jgi:hypothetical protein
MTLLPHPEAADPWRLLFFSFLTLYAEISSSENLNLCITTVKDFPGFFQEETSSFSLGVLLDAAAMYLEPSRLLLYGSHGSLDALATPERACKSPEDTALESMGYKPGLNRSYGLLGMIGFSFSIVTWYVAAPDVASIHDM